MDGRFTNGDREDSENSPANSPEDSRDLPPSSFPSDAKTTLTSSPKRSRRATHKRVVSVPIRDVEGSRLKGETGGPPSDSWAWRKYGQKPIKGSPYPRGYYRCSSSKGCPARKQVERSGVDPTMVVVTYSCEHNHPWPASASRNSHRTAAAASAATSCATSNADQEEKPSVFTGQPQPEPDPVGNFGNLGEECPTALDRFGWFSDLESESSAMLESPMMYCDGAGDADMVFSTREDDESFFADLDELPECSAVFRRKAMERAEEHRRHSLTPCRTTV